MCEVLKPTTTASMLRNDCFKRKRGCKDKIYLEGSLKY